jgi:hypothetical protein
MAETVCGIYHANRLCHVAGGLVDISGRRSFVRKLVPDASGPRARSSRRICSSTCLLRSSIPRALKHQGLISSHSHRHIKRCPILCRENIPRKPSLPCSRGLGGHQRQVYGHGSRELVFLHKPTRTVIEADLLFNLPAKEQIPRKPSLPCSRGLGGHQRQKKLCEEISP